MREVRAAKLRNKVGSLEGTKQVEVKGVAGLEIAEMGGFVKGVIDGLRSVGASKEASRREKEQEERERREEEGDDSDEDML